MCKEVCDYVKTCEDFQRLKIVFKYSSRLKASLTRLLDSFPIDFARTLPKTRREMSSLPICVERLTRWPLAQSTLSVTALEVLTFIKPHVVVRLDGHASSYLIADSVLLPARWRSF